MATDKKFVVKNGLQAQNIDFVDSTTATPTATLTASMNGSSVLSFDSGTLEIDGANNTVSAITFTASGDITPQMKFSLVVPQIIKLAKSIILMEMVLD